MNMFNGGHTEIQKIKRSDLFCSSSVGRHLNWPVWSFIFALQEIIIAGGLQEYLVSSAKRC